jgi:TP901-1 family phage major tail protein
MANQPSITAKSGRNFLLKISDGTSPTIYNTLGGLRASSIALNNNPVDITNKGSAGFREVLPDGGVRSYQMTGTGIVDAAAASSKVYKLLQAAALNATLIEAQILSGVGDSFMGLFAVSNFARTGNHDNAEEYSVTLESSGPLVYSAT